MLHGKDVTDETWLNPYQAKYRLPPYCCALVEFGGNRAYLMQHDEYNNHNSVLKIYEIIDHKVTRQFTNLIGDIDGNDVSTGWIIREYYDDK